MLTVCFLFFFLLALGRKNNFVENEYHRSDIDHTFI